MYYLPCYFTHCKSYIYPREKEILARRKECQFSMEMKSFLIFLVAICAHAFLAGQPPVLHLNFSDAAQNQVRVEANEARYSVDILRQEFAEGLEDYALDLSENAILRRPWVLDTTEDRAIEYNESFTIQVWVKTKRGARLGTAIMSNKPNDSLGVRGWQIHTQDNGAWAINLSDGDRQYNYDPTEKQRINDGLWHQLTLSIEKPKNEARMYRDGKCVAIYNVGSLGDLEGRLRTTIGGSDEYFEWGSEGQWKAFNGYIDEVKIWNRSITSEEVAENWDKHRPGTQEEERIREDQVKIMTWNIWHGGRRYGQHVGVQRVIETIKASRVDVICMIETYGSGAIIADSLGFYFYLISSNLSIMSRYPITETIEAFRPFNFGGAIVELANGQELVVMDTWLHYLPDYLANTTKGDISIEELIEAEEETRASEIKEILEEVQSWISNNESIGVIMAGDFNSGSHLDWIPETKDLHNDYVVEWPVSKSMSNAGFKDSYRELHINALTDQGYTWTPRAATSSNLYGLRDRIDYIYYLGDKLRPIKSEVLDYHPIMFPSDHAAVVTVFQIDE